MFVVPVFIRQPGWLSDSSNDSASNYNGRKSGKYCSNARKRGSSWHAKNSTRMTNNTINSQYTPKEVVNTQSTANKRRHAKNSNRMANNTIASQQTFKEVVDAQTITEKVKQVLNSEDTLDPEHISVFEVWRMCKEIDISEEDFLEVIGNSINAKLQTIDEDYYSLVYDFDNDKNEVRISIYTNKWVDYYFRKTHGDLYLYKRTGKGFDCVDNILNLIGDEIEEYYNHCYSMKYLEEHGYNIKSVNSCFYCDFFLSEVSVYNCNRTFKVKAVTCDKRFECQCNSNNVCQIVSGRENEFAKKVKIAISACPQWMQDELRQIRKQQIENVVRKRMKQEEAEKELDQELTKKQKRRELWKKIFPFIK